MNNQRYLNSLGWFGGIVCLVAYGLNIQQRLDSNSLTFLFMNTIGCCCLIYYTFKKEAFANTVLNGVYLFMTLLAIGKQF